MANIIFVTYTPSSFAAHSIFTWLRKSFRVFMTVTCLPSTFTLIFLSGQSGSSSPYKFHQMIVYHLRWKTTFDGRPPSTEDDRWWKMTFVGRRLSMEDDPQSKITFNRRWLWWKMTFDGRQTLKENVLQWKTTLDRRQPSLENNFLKRYIEIPVCHIPSYCCDNFFFTSLFFSRNCLVYFLWF